MIDRLGNLMSASLRRAGVERSVKAALVADVVLEVIQKQLAVTATAVRIKRVKNKVVTVVCVASVVAEEIRWSESSLLMEINDRLGSKQLERIVATS